MRLSDTEERRTKIIINSVILVIALYGMSQRDYVFQKTSIAERVIIDLMAPVQGMVTSFQRGVSSYVEHYVANLNASKENINLKGKIADLQNEMFSYQESIKESDRLRELIKYGEQIDRKKIVARVVSWDSADDYKVVRINRGLKDGVRLQSVVTSAEGLVGYVYRLTDHFADVITILDANNRVDGVVERLRSHGIVEGYSRGRCIMKYVNRTEPIILNDLVLTAGLGNVYPKGLKIGYISRIERESYGITQHVEITPLVNFSKLEEVLVLVYEQEEHKQLEWKALEEQLNNTEVKR
ncbi:MAG: rod shape-determining protein MreC [Bacteriovorax sp.]|nr:rod shape-determining protein MreC [Bacteriovorax sp.]